MPAMRLALGLAAGMHAKIMADSPAAWSIVGTAVLAREDVAGRGGARTTERRCPVECDAPVAALGLGAPLTTA
jgi:hypothetical protein